MIISHRRRFIFLRTEKTGGTSLSSALAELVAAEGDGEIASLKRPPWAKWSPIHHGALKRRFPRYFGLHPHATARQVRDVVGPDVFARYFKFAVERNPWDRQLSLYFHRRWRKGLQGGDFDRDIRSIRHRMTSHVRLSNWHVYAIGGQVVADRMIRYENLAEEVAQLCADLDLPQLSLPRLRADYRSERKHYASYYSARSRDLIGRWYRREVAALGYRFEGAPGVSAA